MKNRKIAPGLVFQIPICDPLMIMSPYGIATAMRADRIRPTSTALIVTPRYTVSTGDSADVCFASIPHLS